jgi:hypothetical protein
VSLDTIIIRKNMKDKNWSSKLALWGSLKSWVSLKKKTTKKGLKILVVSNWGQCCKNFVMYIFGNFFSYLLTPRFGVLTKQIEKSAQKCSKKIKHFGGIKLAKFCKLQGF